jgi:hypothetical protein
MGRRGEEHGAYLGDWIWHGRKTHWQKFWDLVKEDKECNTKAMKAFKKKSK